MDTGTTEKTRGDYLPVCKVKAPQLQVGWRVGTVPGCLSSGVTRWRRAAQPPALAQGLAEAQLRSVLQQQPVLLWVLPLTSVIFTASARFCPARASLGEVLHLCFGRKSERCGSLCSFSGLTDPAVPALPQSDCWLRVRVSKKPIIHNPDNPQINQAAVMRWQGGKAPHCKSPCKPHANLTRNWSHREGLMITYLALGGTGPERVQN